MKVEISDWVQAKTRNGELIHGFVEALDSQQEMATVYTVKSDNAESVGKSVVVRERWLRKLPEYSPQDSEAIRSLIDIALMTRDEQWFSELSPALSTLANAEDEQTIKNAISYSPMSRMGFPV
ncbi:hypothetical protein [Cohnella cholangitidis]|uniref:IDEAL domain-containing protein n=1 Tax=Cohnella cholangitidis TaxID=2598458 RepID=A0A7G5C2L0_9BACL|nr:hypothetical protein [Cohnella cholangitidis]QMV43444.1 hypothetical protein FPL14_21390 [Cohnella cholangitidis]